MISIIIPCYNAERFLRQTLDSVLGQTYTDWELICVNDGSTDDTSTILDTYSQKDSRIIIISTNNNGVSVARNMGIDAAQGKYIYFVDADDLVSPHALEVLVNSIEHHNADIVKADYIPIDSEGKQLFINKKKQIRKHFNKKVIDTNSFYRKVILDEFFLWTCLFRTDIIKKNHIEFIPQCRFMEDAAFMVEYLSVCETAVYIWEDVYRYRIYGETAGQSKKDYTHDFKLIERKILLQSDSEIKQNFLKKIEKQRVYRQTGYNHCMITFHKIFLHLRYIICKMFN